jgi:microcin C transport system permease protein
LKAYFLRRLLLIPPTLIGITLLVFAIFRMAPGGPIEQSLARLMGGSDGKAKRSTAESRFSLTVGQVMELEEKNNRDKPGLRAYAEWLGLAPKDLIKLGSEFPAGKKEINLIIPGTADEATVKLEGEKASLTAASPELLKDWKIRVVSPETQMKRWDARMSGFGDQVSSSAKKPGYRVVLYKEGYSGILQGDLGKSSKYLDPVWQMIVQRMPVSLYFGIVDLVVIYSVCLPLGILKAIRHRTWLDNASSIAVFTGYAVPGYALGSLLVVYLGAKLGWFPIRGFTGDNFDSLSMGGKVKDLFNHTFMPLICHLVGAFAVMTMMMKNNLMDNLAADYVRTATAKGVSFPAAVFKHAFRNSIIPIASTFGDNLMIIIGGSLLIEKVFDIDGFGLLQYSAMIERDEPLTMGLLFVSALLLMVGNIISDLCVALVDPRVSYK